MTDLRKAAEEVLEAWSWDWSEPRNEALRERMEALRQALAQPEPTVEDNSQNWKGMDGAVAWHLIDRHADNWADIGKMMDEWLKANQAQPEQEPVAWIHTRCGHPLYLSFQYHAEDVPLYTAPPKREWVGLTDEEARDISFNLPIKWTGHLQGAASIYDFARAIEAKLKEKNT